MNVTVKERAESRRGSHETEQPWAEFLYTVRATETAEEADAYQAVLGETWPGPTLEWPLENDTVVVLTRLSVGMDPVVVDERDDPSQSTALWVATVRYGFPRGGTTSSPDNLPWPGVISFDTGGGTQHLKQSLETKWSEVRPAFPPLMPPDHKGAIGVTKDGVEGVDIAVPVFNFTETHQFPELTVDHAQALFNLTARVNQDDFRVFAPGECLFLGASAVRRGTGEWEVEFKFSASPNRTVVLPPPFDSEGFDKGGWDYLWVEHVDEKDEAAQKLVLRPYAAHVERVYEEGDFTRLGIG